MVLVLTVLIAAFECSSQSPNLRALRRPFEFAQYAAQAYRDLLADHGLVGSTGQRGNPYDNAKAESFIKTLKVEAVYPMAYDSFADVDRYLPRFVDEVYNARRFNAVFGYPGPRQFEEQHARHTVKTAAQSVSTPRAHSNPGAILNAD